MDEDEYFSPEESMERFNALMANAFGRPLTERQKAIMKDMRRIYEVSEDAPDTD